MAQRKILTEFTENELRELFREELQNANLAKTKPSNSKRFHPIDWVVEYTGIPKSSIYQMTSKGTIDHIKRGRKLFFEKAQIDRWLEDGKVKTKEEVRQESENFLTKRGRKLR